MNLHKRFWSKVEVAQPWECWLWKAGVDGCFYGKFKIHNKQTTAHRASWIISNGEVPDGLVVCHYCDTPLCCNPNHLFLGTLSDNTNDSMHKGRLYIHGVADPGGSALNESDVLMIRYLWDCGYSRKAIASMMGISPAHATRVYNRKIWKHIPPLGGNGDTPDV